MIEAKIIKDSISPAKIRITTFVLTYPRMIHSEFMTHRMFSRNASSSRAIPVKKQIKMVLNNPAMPLAFKANKAGMQAGESFGAVKQFLCRFIWRCAGLAAVFFSKVMDILNIHKQYANRILEPFAHITVVCTATEFNNFFSLRYHEMAQPEICELAKKMYEVYELSVPKKLKTGQWHLPFIEDTYTIGDTFIKQSVARCARVSYLTHDGKVSNFNDDTKLYDRLLKAVPIHASPAEHQAMATDDSDNFSGNLRGWVQYRKTLPFENVEVFEKPSF